MRSPIRSLRWLILAALVAAWPAQAFWQSRDSNYNVSIASTGCFGGSTYDLNFATSSYCGTTLGAISVVRASSGEAVDNSGNWSSFSSNTPRITNAGLTREESRTNSIRNSTFVGAAAGSARSISGITGLSRTGSASAVLLASNTGGSAVNDLITISAATPSTYNGTWLVMAVSSNVSITFTTATNTTDSASGESVAAVSPGTAPTNWTLLAALGIGYSVGTPTTINGVNVLPITLAGVATASAGYTPVTMETSQQIPATYGQTWTLSEFLYSTGTLPPIYQAMGMNNSSGVSQAITSIAAPSLTGTLTQFQNSLSLSNAATAYAVPLNRALASNGTTYNGILYIGWPQFEYNPFLNSTVASATTNASGSGGVNGTAVYSVGGGTGSAATLNCTWSSGTLTINSVASHGSYTVLPPSPATLTYVSGTASGWTGASVNLTATNNAALAFATTPIPTTNAAVTRAADVITLSISALSAYSLYAVATPETPTGDTTAQVVASVDDGTANNFIQILRSASTGGVATAVTASGASQTVPTVSGTWVQNTQAKLITFVNTGGGQMVFNSTTGSVDSTAITIPSITELTIGADGTGASQFNGIIAHLAVAPTSMLAY